MKDICLTLTILVILSVIQNSAFAKGPETIDKDKEFIQLAQRQSCKTVTTCEQAVIMWCDGYTRADGDGIPCENVCSSKSKVDAIRSRIGC